MRIESYIQMQQVYNKPTVKKATSTSTASFSDKLQISAMGKDIQTAKQAVNSASDVREDLISSIRSGLKDGSYEVSGESFADKLMEKYLGNI